MAGFKHYDSDQYSCSFNGINLFEGTADGEWLTIEPEADDFGDVAGTDGEVTRSKSNDRRATLTLKLMQTSSVNALLSAINTIDKNAPGGAGVGPFFVRDRQGRDVFSAEKAWIAVAPKVSLDRTPTSREWKFRCAELVPFHGGS